jgi:hypothetical protein
MDPAALAGGGSRSVHQWLGELAPAYLERFGSAMPGRHREVLRKILACRSGALGGQLFACPDGHGFAYRYHSCNDRHCPQCGQADADDWLARQKKRLLLPAPYFLVTFTVPEALRRLIRSHPQILLDLLFATSAQALQDLAANPRRLGAQLGMLGVLHTWSRTLIFHPHIHYLVPAGGLSRDGRTWVAARKNYLVSVHALGWHHRTLFQERLKKEQPELFAQVPGKVWQRGWVVDSRAAGSGENALRYLARYVFKTATSNRLVARLPNGRLRWDYRESKTGQNQSISLEPLAWMARFLQHVLPAGFARVRTFGWLHPAAKVRGNRVRALLGQPPLLTLAEAHTWNLPAAKPDAPNAPAPIPTPTVRCGPHCPVCRRPMVLLGGWFAGQDRLLPPKRPP